MSGPNLATQLSGAGISWRAYMGSMPRPYFGGAEVGDYAKRHNPFLYFPSIASNPSLCAHDRLGVDRLREARHAASMKAASSGD